MAPEFSAPVRPLHLNSTNSERTGYVLLNVRDDEIEVLAFVDTYEEVLKRLEFNKKMTCPVMKVEKWEAKYDYTIDDGSISVNYTVKRTPVPSDA